MKIIIVLSFSNTEEEIEKEKKLVIEFLKKKKSHQKNQNKI